MATIIDRTAVTLLSALGFYLFFLYAWGNIPAACGAAFVCCILMRFLLRRLPLKKRASAAQVRAELLRIATLDESAACDALSAIVRRRYPGETFSLAPVLKHPEATMNCGDVLNAWKANRDAERLVIASTCPCEPRAALYARELQGPTVAILDSRRLARMLRSRPADDLPAAPSSSAGVRLRSFLARIGTARVSPKNALLAIALLSGYFVGGNPWWLFSSLALLLHLGMALAQGRTGRQLFEPK